MLWPNVKTFQNGVDRLDAATLNEPINQLIARTAYLKNLLEASASRTNVAIADAALAKDAQNRAPALGQPVYRVPGGNAYARAAATVGDVEESKWFWADQQAMAVGIVGSTPSGDSATVVLSGYVSFGDTGIDPSGVIADDAPASGRYFLSATPGKLTAAPTGPIIYVCDCEIRQVAVNGVSTPRVMSMLVNPQYRDTGESHIHRAFVLSGKPCGYAVIVDNARYRVAGVVPSRYTKTASAMPTNTVVAVPLGHWAYAGAVTYTITAKDGGTKIDWTSGGADGSGTGVAMSYDAPVAIGSHGLAVKFVKQGTPNLASLDGQTWTFNMPTDGRVWLDHETDGDPVGFRLNLGMYPEMARFVPPLPVNGAALVVDGVELRSPAFGSKKRWEILDADSTTGGPWLVWYGGEVAGVSYTAPFEWNATIASQGERDIVLHANRMRVGPTGFVTSLQAAPGSPLKVTSAQTGATAFQGALQVGLDIDFKSEAGNAEGAEVVKKIVGGTFVTGPVVERVVAGPGMDVDRQQGTVTVSVSNAVYAGDFETIALKNAKQDLVGAAACKVFPYTKLLGWTTNGVNVDSGFTARFRVPDHIPYKDYYVVVSTSVFGEASIPADGSAAAAAFRLTAYALADQACAADAPSTGLNAAATSPAGGYAAVVTVPFAAGYRAFDPILLHGFGTGADGVAAPGSLALPDNSQRVSVPALWLMSSATGRVKLKPGYFVGISVERCDVDGTDYTAPLGFLSLRWNLVPVV